MVDEATCAVIELESYLASPRSIKPVPVGFISPQQEREPHCNEKPWEEQEVEGAVSTVHTKQESFYSAVTRIAERLDHLKGILEKPGRITKLQQGNREDPRKNTQSLILCWNCGKREQIARMYDSGKKGDAEKQQENYLPSKLGAKHVTGVNGLQLTIPTMLVGVGATYFWKDFVSSVSVPIKFLVDTGAQCLSFTQMCGIRW